MRPYFRKREAKETEEFNFDEVVDIHYQRKLNIENNMENGILKLSWVNVWSALVYGVLAMAQYVISQGTVIGLYWKILVDVGVLGLLSSLIKNILTTNQGNFVGLIKVIPPVK